MFKKRKKRKKRLTEDTVSGNVASFTTARLGPGKRTEDEKKRFGKDATDSQENRSGNFDIQNGIDSDVKYLRKAKNRKNEKTKEDKKKKED